MNPERMDNMDSMDIHLKRLFCEQKEADAQSAPSLASLARVSSPRAQYRVRWFRLAMAVSTMAMILAVSVSLINRRLNLAEDDMARWAAFSQWQASTDALLISPAASWGGQPATITDSLIPANSNATDL